MSINTLLFIIINLISIFFPTFIFFLGETENQYIFAILTVFICGCWYCLRKIKDRILFLCFLIAFFNFLIGRSLLLYFGIRPEEYAYMNNESIGGQKIILLAIFTLVYGYLLIEKILNRREKNKKNNENKFNFLIRHDNSDDKILNFSKKIFYITYPFAMIVAILTIIYVSKNGYASLYVGDYIKVNIFLKKIGDLMPMSFIMMLGTLPEKKKIIIPTILYAIYLIVTVFIGARFDFVIGIVFLIAYLFLREFIDRKNGTVGTWMNVKKVLIIGLIGLISIMGLSALNYIRFGLKVDKSQSFIHFITDFIYDQGVSSNIPKRIFKYSRQLEDIEEHKKHVIESDHKVYYRVPYSLSSTISYVDKNMSRIGLIPAIASSSEDSAILHTSLSDRLSFIMYKNAYLKGHGGGSSYVAASYLDLGFLGVIIANIIYIALIIFIQKNFAKNYILFIVGMALFMALLKVPRSEPDYFIPKLLNPVMWGMIIASLLFLSITYKRRKNRG